MKINELQQRPQQLVAQLLKVWEASVRATHLFLSDGQIRALRPQALQALQTVPHLVVAEDAAGSPIAFMGADGQKLEMLFVAPEMRGKGLGRQLLRYGFDAFKLQTLEVNEQNPLAKGFYEHMGFVVYKRSA